MMHPKFSFDSSQTVIIDASVIINLNATNYAQDILTSLPNHIAVVQEVISEINEGRNKGRHDADLLEGLIDSGLIDIVELNDSAIELFESLVIGPANSTLDDGESATIAYALEENFIAVLDERKAHRICKERFPDLRVGCTADIFLHPFVQETLGLNKISSSLANALQYARMRILPEYTEWVTDIIGIDNLEKYRSLPKSVRQI
jgi:predicted nucleic acid-binding protein